MNNSIPPMPDWFIPISLWIMDMPAYQFDHNSELIDVRSFPSLQDAENYWDRLLKTFNIMNGHWEDRRHFGDCTNAPISCATCAEEDIKKDAKLLWDRLCDIFRYGLSEAK